MGEVLIHHEDLLVEEFGSPVADGGVNYEVSLRVQGNGHVVGRVQRCADEGASGTELLDCLRNVAKLIVTASVDQHVAAGAEELHLGVPENVEIPVDSLADYAISVVSVAKELGHTRCLCLKG